MSTTTPFTAEMLLQMPNDGYRYELVAGEMKQMTPAGWIQDDQFDGEDVVPGFRCPISEVFASVV